MWINNTTISVILQNVSLNHLVGEKNPANQTKIIIKLSSFL